MYNIVSISPLTSTLLEQCTIHSTCLWELKLQHVPTQTRKLGCRTRISDSLALASAWTSTWHTSVAKHKEQKLQLVAVAGYRVSHSKPLDLHISPQRFGLVGNIRTHSWTFDIKEVESNETALWLTTTSGISTCFRAWCRLTNRSLQALGGS